MTAWQRQGTGSATAVAPIVNGSAGGVERSVPFSWEEWFRHASPPQRTAALDLAQLHGLLYAHQLPATTNGKPNSSAGPETYAATLLARLLAGKTETLAALPVEHVSFFDTDLDELQQQAVRRALGTPDLFMLQGLPGTGKSRVLTEIVLQAAARSRRVLLLAAHTSSLDVVLHRLVGRPEVLPLRQLDALEKPESLPPWLRGFTLDEQKQAFFERMLVGARGNHAQTETVCRQRRAEEPIWTELQSCLERRDDCIRRLQALQDQLPGLNAAVQRDSDDAQAEFPFAHRLREMGQSHTSAVRELDAHLQAQKDALSKWDQESATLAGRISALAPGYHAKKHARFWTLAFWLNLFNGKIVPEMDALLDQQAKAQAQRSEVAGQIAHLESQRRQRQEQFDAERAELLAAEVHARQQALGSQQQALQDQQRQLDDEWDALCRRCDAGAIEKTSAALAAAQQAWLRKKQLDDEQCQFAQQWTAFIEATGPQLAARLPSFANVIAGTVMRWQTDAKFRDAAAGPFDLLIVEDADTLSETDLLKLARHGHRLVLAGQALAEATPTPTAAEKASRTLLPTPLASAGCWSRLWQALGGDAGHWPCKWHCEHGRLVCQLMPLTAEDRQHLESEGLADAADIELRILHRPRTRPCLAQVIFAPAGNFEDAFTFMVREVQEFPLEPLGRTAWWCESENCHARHLGPHDAVGPVWLEIEPGVRLGTVSGAHGEAPRVARIEFDKSAGWDRAKADAWLRRHRPDHDHERTVFLQTPYRFQRPLAEFVQGVVRASDWLTTRLPHITGMDKPIEFVAVPALAKRDWPREGAGLELDLSAGRQADRLPTGLRSGLPPRGFVNYLEAQALIRRLETWMQKELNGQPCHIAVLALYEGQVELLRRLTEQSEILRGRNFHLEIALPSRLHQRECDAVFLSLTRSHAHRCVAFGEDVRELPLALTRARRRLFLFGDPGALCKRINWQGPLEHLDAHASHQEHLRLSRLVAFLQEQTPTPTHANGTVSSV